MARKRPLSRLDLQRREAVLEALREGASASEAARSGGITRQAVFQWRQADEEFALAYHDAEEAGTDELERVAVKRAKESSDTLLIFLLKARRPAKYRERIDLTAKVEQVTSAELTAARAAAEANPEAMAALARSLAGGL